MSYLENRRSARAERESVNKLSVYGVLPYEQIEGPRRGLEARDVRDALSANGVDLGRKAVKKALESLHDKGKVGVRSPLTLLSRKQWFREPKPRSPQN